MCLPSRCLAMGIHVVIYARSYRGVTAKCSFSVHIAVGIPHSSLSFLFKDISTILDGFRVIQTSQMQFIFWGEKCLLVHLWRSQQTLRWTGCVVLPMKSIVLWVVTSCCSADVHHVSEGRIASIFRVEEQEIPWLPPPCCWPLASLTFRPWTWDQNVSPKCRWTLTVAYGVISQNMRSLLRGPYTYEFGSRVRLGSGSNEPNSSVTLIRVWWN
jgi:hypothetical protein